MTHPKGETETLGSYDLFLLAWLSKEDASSLGECKGEALDKLVRCGLAKIYPAREGVDPDYSLVALTIAGYRLANSEYVEAKGQ